MPDASTIDVQTPFDITGYATISAAELQQWGSGILPYTDKGLIVATDDVSGNPNPPDATTETKWQKYLWLRISVSSVTLYAWNPSATTDPDFIKWQSVTQSSIAPGSITAAMLASGSVTNDKIVSVAYTKITGAPAGLPPSGAAGGDLTGTFPNPTIAPNAVTSTKLSSDASIDANRAVTGNSIKNNVVDITRHLVIPAAAALQIMRVNSAGTNWEVFSSVIALLTNPVVGDALKLVRVNSGGSAFEYVTPATIGRVLQVVTARDNTVDSTATNVGGTTGVTISNTKLSALTVTLTPKSTTSTLIVEAIVFLLNTGGGGNTNAYVGAIMRDSDSAAKGISVHNTGSFGASQTYPDAVPVYAEVVSGALTATTFKIYFGGINSTTYYNSTSGGVNPFNAGLYSSIKVTEYE